MDRMAAALLIGLLLPVASPAQEASPDSAQAKHEVRKGDTLWDLAQRYLEDPFNWPEIYEANREKIEDPHWIYPGQMFLIPPHLLKEGMVEEVAVQPAAEAPPAEPRERGRTVFYPREEEGGAEGTTLLTDEARNPPPVRAHEHYAATWLSGASMPDFRGTIREVLGSTREGKLPDAALPYHRVHIEYESAPRPSVGDELLSVRVDRSVDGHGSIIQPTGRMTVERTSEDAVVATVTSALDRLRVGNRILPLDGFRPVDDPEYVEVSDGLEGAIVAFRSARDFPQIRSEVYLDIGAADGVRVGDEFVVVDADAPAGEDINARIRILRVEETSATGLFDDIYTQEIAPGMPVRLVRRVR